MILSIGEILFDIFPGYKRIGGAPFNFAYHLLKMGMKVRLVTRIGRDDAGEEALSFLDANGFTLTHIQRDGGHETGKVIIKNDSRGHPRFEISTDAAYDFLEFDSVTAAALQQTPDLIYFGSLIQRTPGGFSTLQKLLSARPAGTRCFYDINLRPRCYSAEIVEASLHQCDVLKVNEEELDYLKTLIPSAKRDVGFIDTLMRAYDIEMVALTKGGKGSEVFTANGSYAAETDAMETLVDTVGAGDAYAAMMALGFLKNWPPEHVLSKATELSRRICTVEGAIPGGDAFYQGLMEDAEAFE